MGLSRGQSSGFENPEVLGMLALFVTAGLFFIIVELKSKNPVIDFDIFRNIFFSANLLVTFLFYFAISSVFVLANSSFHQLVTNRRAERNSGFIGRHYLQPAAWSHSEVACV